MSVAKAQNYNGEAPHRKNVNQEGGHRTSKFGHMFILEWGHHTIFQKLAVGRVGGNGEVSKS